MLPTASQKTLRPSSRNSSTRSMALVGAITCKTKLIHMLLFNDQYCFQHVAISISYSPLTLIYMEVEVSLGLIIMMCWVCFDMLNPPWATPTAATLGSFPSCCWWHLQIPDVGFQVPFYYPFIKLGFTRPLCIYYLSHPYYKGIIQKPLGTPQKPSTGKLQAWLGLAGVWQ